MSRSMRSNFILAFTVIVSVFGSFTILMLGLHPPKIGPDFFWRKPLIGSIFTLICISGIIAGLSPQHCTHTFRSLRTKKTPSSDNNSSVSQKMSIAFKGHHPDCRGYSNHVIRVNEHVLCAACIGLLLGAFTALAGTFAYFVGGWKLGQASLPALLLGQAGIFFGLVQIKFRGYSRLIVNGFFVLAAFLTLVGIDELAENVFIDLYVLALIVFWLMTRILISQWDYWKICQTCETPCRLAADRG